MSIMKKDKISNEDVGRCLYQLWCGDDVPDWAAYDAGGNLNPVGLNKDDFELSADSIVDGLAKCLCMDNQQPECLDCTFETCTGFGFHNDARKLLTGRI